MLASHEAVVKVAAPSHSIASVRLYADGHAVSEARKLRFRRAHTAHVTLDLTKAGVKRLRSCDTHKLEVRVSITRGKHTTTVRDRDVLALDARKCPVASKAAKPVDTPKPPVETPKPVDTP